MNVSFEEYRAQSKERRKNAAYRFATWNSKKSGKKVFAVVFNPSLAELDESPEKMDELGFAFSKQVGFPIYPTTTWEAAWTDEHSYRDDNGKQIPTENPVTGELFPPDSFWLYFN